MERSLKQVDLLRHELKALRYILDNLDTGRLAREKLPAREDFQSEQGRALYEIIAQAPGRAAAEQHIAKTALEGVDIGSFLSLSGGHYYSYPALVRQRAAEIRAGRLRVESA